MYQITKNSQLFKQSSQSTSPKLQKLSMTSQESQNHKNPNILQNHQNNPYLTDLFERIGNIQQNLNKQCSYCDSLMPILHLYDYGMAITRYEQNLKNLNKNITIIQQKLNQQKRCASMGQIRINNQSVGMIKQQINENISNSNKNRIQARVYRLQQQIRHLSSAYQQRMDIKSNNDNITSYTNREYKNNLQNMVLEFRTKIINDLAIFRNKIMNSLNHHNSQKQEDQIADKWIQQQIINKIYIPQKQRLAAMKINIQNVLPFIINSQQQCVEDNKQQQVLDMININLRKLQDFHNFTYNRIGKQLSQINQYLEDQFKSIIERQQQLNNYKTNIQYSNKTNKSQQYLKIKLKLLKWQINGVKRKYHKQISSYFKCVGKYRSQIYNNNAEKTNQSMGLYEQLINFPIKKQQQIAHNQQIQQIQYQIKKFQEVVSQDIINLQYLLIKIENKYITLYQSDTQQGSNLRQSTLQYLSANLKHNKSHQIVQNSQQPHYNITYCKTLQSQEYKYRSVSKNKSKNKLRVFSNRNNNSTPKRFTIQRTQTIPKQVEPFSFEQQKKLQLYHKQIPSAYSQSCIRNIQKVKKPKLRVQSKLEERIGKQIIRK